MTKNAPPHKDPGLIAANSAARTAGWELDLDRLKEIIKKGGEEAKRAKDTLIKAEGQLLSLYRYAKAHRDAPKNAFQAVSRYFGGIVAAILGRPPQ